MTVREELYNGINIQKPIRFVFWIRKAEVFSFWVSDDERGKSRGYMGAGSTNCEGIRDI